MYGSLIKLQVAHRLRSIDHVSKGRAKEYDPRAHQLCGILRPTQPHPAASVAVPTESHDLDDMFLIFYPFLLHHIKSNSIYDIKSY